MLPTSFSALSTIQHNIPSNALVTAGRSTEEIMQNPNNNDYLKENNSSRIEMTDEKLDMSIVLQSIKFDPNINVPRAESVFQAINNYQESGYFIVQFDGPIKTEQKHILIELGVHIYGYVPHYAFIVKMNNWARQNVERLPFIHWVGIYQPAYRVSSTVKKTVDSTESILVNVLTFDADVAQLIGKIQALGGQVEKLNDEKLRVLIENSKIPEIAQMNGVIWIEKYIEPQICNNVSAGIIKADPVIWNTHGLTGTDQVIAIADTGLDTGVNDVTMHDDFEGRIDAIHSWPVRSGFGVINGGADDGASDLESGHGTHVTGSALGNGSKSGGVIKGIAYDAHLVFQAIEQYVKYQGGYGDGYTLAGIPDNLSDLFTQSYNDFACIQSNSWEASTYGEYTSMCHDTDEFLWNHKDMTILFGAGNDGVDANPADGIIDYGSIGSPATAKNVIAVGASENFRPSGAGVDKTWGKFMLYTVDPIASDHVSNNPDGMAAFSSRGPCDDGRIKPDVVAPGTNILSTRSSMASGTGWGLLPFGDLKRPFYEYMGGTSMATPLTAGSAALIREYYMTRRGHTPTAALIKATIINGATDMPGQYSPDETGPVPNNNEGWGRVNLENSLFPSAPATILFSDSEYSLSTGDSKTFYYSVNDTSIPLKATLTWTDFPGSVPAGGLNNDLDFIIISPSEKKYLGNDFTAPYDDVVDRTNNVEQIRIDSPEKGIYTIRVSAFNVPNGPQDFSFVICGGSNDTTSPIITVPFPNEGKEIHGRIKLRITAADSSGIDWVKYAIRFPGGAQGRIINQKFESLNAIPKGDNTWELIFDTTLLPDGNYVLFVNASDMAGNEGYKTANFSIKNLDQQQTKYTNNFWLYSTYSGAQSFTPTVTTLSYVEVYMRKVGNPSADVVVSIRSALTGQDLVSLSIPASQIPTTNGWVKFDFSDLTVTPGSTYYLVLRTSGGSILKYYSVGYGSGNLYRNGVLWTSITGGAPWWQNLGYDLCFKTYGFT